MSTKSIRYNDMKNLREILLGRKVESVEQDTLTLDNGVKLKVVANEGCGGCESGWYEIESLNKFDNIITDVRISESETEEYDERITIYVFSESEIMHPLIKVRGDEGNGFYGRGFEIEVKGVE